MVDRKIEEHLCKFHILEWCIAFQQFVKFQRYVHKQIFLYFPLVFFFFKLRHTVTLFLLNSRSSAVFHVLRYFEPLSNELKNFNSDLPVPYLQFLLVELCRLGKSRVS